jgi:hypothetical protein
VKYRNIIVLPCCDGSVLNYGHASFCGHPIYKFFLQQSVLIYIYYLFNGLNFCYNEKLTFLQDVLRRQRNSNKNREEDAAPPSCSSHFTVFLSVTWSRRLNCARVGYNLSINIFVTCDHHGSQTFGNSTYKVMGTAFSIYEFSPYDQF